MIFQTVLATGILFGQIPVANLENEAIAHALADVKSLAARDRRYMRYVELLDKEIETLQAISLTSNYVSQNQNIARPWPVPYKNGLLARIDLRRISTDAKIDKLIVDWEEFRFDPRYNLLLTRNTIQFALGIGLEIPKKKTKKLIDVPSYVWKDGHTYNQKWVDYDSDFDDQDVVRVVGEHINKGLIAELIDHTHSQAPIISSRYFVFRGLSTIKDDGIYKTILGGLYFDLAGIPQNSKEGSDEDNLLEQLGVGNVKQRVRAVDIFNKLPSDQRTAVFESNVAQKRPRRVEYLKTLAGRNSQGLAVFTRDVKRKSIDIGQHAIMNLLVFQHDASEGIFEKTNGLQGFVTLDGKGKILQAVASDVAADRTVPSPYSPDLQAAIGCMRCHSPEGGWRIARNDVKKLVGGRFDILTDLNFGYHKDVFERLAGLYAGDLELKILPRARDDNASAILLATGPWKGSKDQTDIVRLASAKIADIYKEAAYTSIDAKYVLADLGIKVKTEKEAIVTLNRVLPPPSVLYIPSPEDPRIEALRRGMSISQIDYALTYAFICRRVQLSGGKK